MKYFNAVLFLVICVGLPSASFAQDTERMKKLSEQALVAFEAGEFEKAAQLFSDAFEAYPDYNLKKNEMVAWFKAHNCRDAKIAGKRFVDRQEGVEQKDLRDFKNVKIRCDIREAENHVNHTKIAEAKAALVKAKSHGDIEPPDQKKIETIEKRIADLEKPDEVIPPKVEPPPERAKWPLYLGGSLLAAGAVGLAAVPIWFIIDQNSFDDAKNSVPNCRFDSDADRLVCTSEPTQEQIDALTSKPDSGNTGRLILGITSGVAIGVGTVLLIHYISSAPDEEPGKSNVMFTPEIGPDHAGATLRVTF